ncbi:Ubiquitin carboxyl-terminal hydrolase [Gracilaria domingensis]|nr:Ubiquitin carboxyl-terminal hydrolase [Gracilaria domingensis]
MDLVAWESIEGFDFLKYNTSPRFCGLENALPNVYVNPAVQALYFCPPVRTAIGNHSCHRDWCISFELSFLFHMFDLGGAGMACEAGNFTRAFMTIANAGALGVLDGAHALPLSQRIENFTRYLLEQLHKDEGVDIDSSVLSVFGAETRSHGTFMASKTDWKRIAKPSQHSLIDKVPRNTSFCKLVEHSLHHRGEATRAFCEASRQFESMTQHRELRNLPNVLLLGCNTKINGYSEWWFDVSESSYPLRSPSNASLDLDEIAERTMQQEKKIMESMRIELTDGISVTEIDSLASCGRSALGYDAVEGSFGDTGDLMAEYDLSFVVALVPPTSKGVEAINENDGSSARNVAGHLVAYIHVPRVYSEKGNELGEKREKPEVDKKHADAAWWCFNDFLIAPCQGFEEVAAFHKFWKKPCVLAYVRRDIKNRVRMEINDTLVDVREVIGEENHNEAIGLQPDEAVPVEGTVLALDCEFVMVSRDEADVFGDGAWQMVVAARMALARVSVIRGYGRLKGVALMDDYVAVREEVVDYLTRFSGLSEGDLDATRSPHKVSSLKTVYKRLRCLVDAGCIFVGHGL